MNASIKYSLQNLIRLLVCVAATFCAIAIGKKLDKGIGLMGALLCAPLAITMPALLHLKVVAVTNKEKIEDILIIAISLGVLILSTS